MWLFGFPSKDFASADYFPLLPWFFIFFAGFFFCRMFKTGFPAFSEKIPCPFFALVGRHALPIYILHQPVIYLVCQAVYKIL